MHIWDLDHLDGLEYDDNSSFVNSEIVKMTSESINKNTTYGEQIVRNASMVLKLEKEGHVPIGDNESVTEYLDMASENIAKKAFKRLKDVTGRAIDSIKLSTRLASSSESNIKQLITRIKESAEVDKKTVKGCVPVPDLIKHLETSSKYHDKVVLLIKAMHNISQHFPISSPLDKSEKKRVTAALHGLSKGAKLKDEFRGNSYIKSNLDGLYPNKTLSVLIATDETMDKKLFVPVLFRLADNDRKKMEKKKKESDTASTGDMLMLTTAMTKILVDEVKELKDLESLIGSATQKFFKGGINKPFAEAIIIEASVSFGNLLREKKSLMLQCTKTIQFNTNAYLSKKDVEKRDKK